MCVWYMCVCVDIALECQLEHLEGWLVCYAADRDYGEHSTGRVQKTPQTPERNKGQFYHTEFIK